MDLKVLDPTTLPGTSAQVWSDRKGSWIRHALLSASFVLFYVLLNRPEVLLISKLGFTIWYPATGLAFALMLGVSPWYALLICFAKFSGKHRNLPSAPDFMGRTCGAHR